MKKLIIAGSNLKEQYRIKSFLEKDFLVEANPSVHNCVPIIRENQYDMILFDTDNVVPLKVFISEIERYKVKTPVTALISFSDLDKIKKLKDLDIVAVVKKPCNKQRLLGGINKGFYYFERLQAKKKKKKTLYKLTRSESNILICLKKHAILTNLRREGLDLLLPTSLDLGTKLLFRSPELYSKIGLTYEKPPRLNLEIKNCIPVDNYQYQVEANFDLTDASCLNFYNCLHRYIEQNALRSKSSSNKKTVLISEADMFTKEFYQVALQNKGYQLIFAYDGIQTLEMLEQHSVDLLIMDLLLPRLSGQEVMDIMQKRNIRKPVIIATGESNPEVVQQVKPYVQDYMLKPIGGQDLSEKLAAVFEKLGDSSVANGEPELSLQIESDIDLMVAFQEHVKLLDLSDTGLIFARHNPIVPGTIIMLKTDAISVQVEESSSEGTTIELGVTRCKHQKDGQYFIIQASFNTDDTAFQ